MKISILIISLIIFLSCNKSESNAPDAIFDAPVITGYKLIDNNGSARGLVGKPNVKTGISVDGIDYQLGVYPIPTIGFLGVAIKAPNDGQKRQIWIKRAVLIDIVPDVYHFNTINMKANASVFDTTITENKLFIDKVNIPNGYYRLYVSVSGQILYENIVITN